MKRNDFYVYVYIDPRNHEEFYYGKGQGSRKNAHLFDRKSSQKTARIKKIRAAQLKPIIRVVASNLTEYEAFLIESALIWKMGGKLTNTVRGLSAARFRDRDMLHRELSGFDYNNSIYYYNVGECEFRNWTDYCKYGFISAGQGKKFGTSLQRLRAGDIVCAFYKKKGYVGIGKVEQEARPIKEVRIKGKPLLQLKLQAPKMHANKDNLAKCEYVALVKWKKFLKKEEAKKKRGIFANQNIVASLRNQPDTIKFIEKEFDIEDIYSMVK